MKKYVYIFLVLFLVGINVTAFSKEKKALVVGTTSGYAPFVSLNGKGEYEGFDVDVAKEVSKKLRRPLFIKDCGSMPSLMLSLKQNKVEMIIWAISITEKRLENMEMVYYQGEKIDQTPLIFWDEIPNDIKSISDLGGNPNYLIAVEAGSYQEDILTRYPNIRLKYLNQVSDVIMDLKYGKSTASTIDPSIVKRLQRKYPQIKVLYLPLPNEDISLGNGICINKNNQKLAFSIRESIEELINEGKIKSLERKWGLESATK